VYHQQHLLFTNAGGVHVEFVASSILYSFGFPYFLALEAHHILQALYHVSHIWEYGR
jgi:hypothetical protein